ncbi:hypothetical protein [uncultured Nostoc sp.]|uniref:hypothetical protein n=1 Tax=uncultured Nostoc sp. TaxID=340711 RepID=UPI0035CB7400
MTYSHTLALAKQGDSDAKPKLEKPIYSGIGQIITTQKELDACNIVKFKSFLAGIKFIAANFTLSYDALATIAIALPFGEGTGYKREC